MFTICKTIRHFYEIDSPLHQEGSDEKQSDVSTLSIMGCHFQKFITNGYTYLLQHIGLPDIGARPQL